MAQRLGHHLGAASLALTEFLKPTEPAPLDLATERNLNGSGNSDKWKVLVAIEPDRTEGLQCNIWQKTFETESEARVLSPPPRRVTTTW
eukprot:SAG22_NODE_363_length_11694_cov_40.815783_16_plen_89_part_00